MDYFSPGFREIIRLAQRAGWRLRERMAERRLAAAELHLGLLGWQQADFDTETQRQVEAIHNVEREQASLTNRAAELSHAIEGVLAERAAARAQFETEKCNLQGAREQTRTQLAEIDRQLETIRSHPTDGRQRIAALERDMRESEALHAKLMAVNPQPSYVREEIQKLSERIIAIPNEIKDIKAAEQQRMDEEHDFEQRRNTVEQQIGLIDKQMTALTTEADKKDATFAATLRGLEKERARVEAANQRLERAKGNPYREIGRVLADSGLAPLNQPEALTNVVTLRDRIAQTASAIDESLGETRAEDGPLLRVSLLLWAVILFATVLLVAGLF